MADYVSKYTGKQIDEAVGKALQSGSGTVTSVNGVAPDAEGNVALEIPAAPEKVSELDNDAGYLTGNELPDAISDALADAKAAGVFDGADGVSPTVAVSKRGKVTTLTITDAEGTKTATVNDGEDGYTPVKGVDYFDGAKGDPGADYSFDPTVYGLPILYLTGDISPIRVSKDNKVDMTYVYGERSGACKLKGQGATSYKTAQAMGEKGKYNYTITFDEAFEAHENWGSQKKYCLKANYIDHSHSRNVVSAKLWGLIVKSRTNANANLASLVNGGAVDGFPVVIMLNNEFHGLYTFNVPKDGWMMGLVEDPAKQQAILGANDHELATQFKGLLAGDESDFELEFVSDEDNAAWVTTSLNRMLQACMDSWGGDLDDVVGQYLDWDSVIDYYIWIVVCKGTDMVDKNYLLSTFDGTKWHMTAYDMDSTYGLNWDGSGLTRAVSNVNFTECAATHRAYELVKRFKTNALKSRYNALRSNVLSETRIMQYFEAFAWAIPSPLLVEDVKRYPAIPGSCVNSIDQIGRWVRQRLEAADAWIAALPAQETPVEPEKPVEVVNLVPKSIDTDGSIYNGVGYKANVRLSSSGGVSSSAQAGSVTTGFIQYTYKAPFIVRMKGATWLGESAATSGTHWYINFYNTDKTFLYGAASDAVGVSGNGYASQMQVSYDATTGVTTFDFSPSDGYNGAIAQAVQTGAYFRLNAKGKGADLVITVNQEIV